MLKNVFRKVKIFVILILFVITSALPNISGNAVVEINNSKVMYPEKINKCDILPIFINREYFFGPIYNLTITKESHLYEFESNNIREFWIFFINVTTFLISYQHYKCHSSFHIGGRMFRGILKPTFICGYFY